MTHRPLHIVTTLGFFLLYSLGLSAQTKISIPPAKVNFNEIGKGSKEKKQRLKEVKSLEKEKREKLRRVRKTIKEKSNLPKDSITFFTDMLSTLKLPEIEEILIDLDDIKVDVDSFNSKERSTQALEQWKESVPTFDYLPDSIDLSQLASLDSLKFTDYLQTGKIDSTMLDSLKLKNHSLDGLFKEYNPIDSSMFQLDSSLLTNIPVNIDSTLLKNYPYTMDSMSLEVNPVSAYLENFVAEKVKANYDLSMPEFDTGEGMVKQYIPSLEKFNFEKPTIPEDKLVDALIQKEIEEKKQRLKKIISTEDAPEKKRTLKERIQIGGYFQYKPTPQSIEVTPSIAYKATDKWRLGGGYIANINFEKDNPNRMGYRVFTEYDLPIGYYIHLESEWMIEKRSEMNDIKTRSTYLGLGKSIQFKSIKSDIQFLYNFDAPNALQSQRFTIRFGLNFTK